MTDTSQEITLTITQPMAIRTPTNQAIGGLHVEYASATVTDASGNPHTVEVSGGFGCGHDGVYVSVDGKRVLTGRADSWLSEMMHAALKVAGIGIEEAP